MAAAVEAGIAVRGWKEMNAALRRLGSDTEYGIAHELKQRVKRVGDRNARAAERFITHKYGHSQSEPLEGSMRVSVTGTRGLIYSTSAHGGAQDHGAAPKAGWSARGPHITRAKASKWAQRGVEAEREWTQAEMEGLCDWVVHEYESDFYI